MSKIGSMGGYAGKSWSTAFFKVVRRNGTASTGHIKLKDAREGRLRG